jgi:hypothetical protein
VERCLSWNNDGNGFQAGTYPGSTLVDCTFRYCVSINDGQVAGRAIFRTFGGSHLNTRFYQCTGYSTVASSGFQADGNGHFAYNNIVIVAPGVPALAGKPAAGGTENRNNILRSTDGTVLVHNDTNSTDYHSIAAWQAFHANSTGNIASDPGCAFTGPADDDSRPTTYTGVDIGTNSPAKNAGLDIAAQSGSPDPGTLDFHGRRYPVGLPDIGAVEFAAGVPRVGSPFVGRGNNFASAAVRQLVGGGV